jgi:hypothetical protein
MRSSVRKTRDISERERKSSAVDPLGKLCRMLRNILRSYPTAKLLHGRDGFGALLGEQRLIYIRWNGDLSDQDLRDLLVLFATWLVVDPERLHDAGINGQGGASYMETEQRYLSNGRLD